MLARSVRATTVVLSALFYCGSTLAGITFWSDGVVASPSGPDPLFSFSIDVNGNIAGGTLNAVALGGGQFLATGGTLNVTGGADIGTYSLLAGGPAATLSPSAGFIFDDVLHYQVGDPFLDVDGLLFRGGGLEINIWGNSPGNYSFYSYNGSSYNVAATADARLASLTQAPEPATLALLALGLGGLGFSRRRKLN